MGKKKPLNFWQSGHADGRESNFIMLGNSWFSHPVVQSLRSSEFRVYVSMLNEAQGRKEFKFPYRKYKGSMSKETFLNARDGLIRKEMITIVENNKNLRKENVYAFVPDWHQHDRKKADQKSNNILFRNTTRKE